MAELNFDASEYEPRAGFEPVPTGRYRVHIIASEVKENKKGTGDLLELELEILEDGQYQGQRVWDRLNINNQSERATTIARNKLSLICHCIGKMHVADTEELHEIPLLAAIRYRPERIENGSTYRASNEIDKYYPDDEAGGGGAASQEQGEPPAPAKAAKVPAGRVGGGAVTSPKLGDKKAPWRQAGG